jgi:hypothetical protein
MDHRDFWVFGKWLFSDGSVLVNPGPQPAITLRRPIN